MKNQHGILRFWAIIIPAIATIAVAVVQFGPKWKDIFGSEDEDAIAQKKLNYYIANIVLEELGEVEVNGANVKVIYNVTAELYSSDRDELYYRDRVKAIGGIEYAKSIPSYQVMNPTQYPANPTLFEFRIDPMETGINQFSFNGILAAKTILDDENGKFGPHIPYDTDFALVMVDFSRLKDFYFPLDMTAQIEARSPRGELQYGAGAVTLRNWYKLNKTLTIIAHDLPAGASILLSWGDPI